MSSYFNSVARSSTALSDDAETPLYMEMENLLWAHLVHCKHHSCFFMDSLPIKLSIQSFVIN